MAEQCVFLGLPCRPGESPAEAGTIRLVKPAHRGKFRVARVTCSLLNLGFNRLWVNALNARARDGLTHFGMQHSDVVPAAGWCDVEIDELARTGADIVSALIPIKDPRALTSTGVRNVETGQIRRVTMREAMRLPETFGLEELLAAGIDVEGRREDKCLIVNTGLWTCRLDRDWVDHFPGFRTADVVIKNETGLFEARCLPEDWLWSEWCHRRGVRMLATRKVPLAHVDGAKEYRNDSAWGEWETDLGD